MLRYYTLCLMALIGLICNGKEKIVIAQYLYQIPENVSHEKAKETALIRAQQQAIAEEFGLYVTQSSISSVQISPEETRSDFFSTGGSEARGEWIETIGQPEYEFITDGGTVAIRVSVKGRIREIDTADIPVDIRIFRNGIENADESDVFGCGDGLYMSFKSSLNGYLAIYMIDNADNVYCLLPYCKQTDGIFATKSNRRYILFHPEYSDGINRDLVDELTMETEFEREHDRILTIFSPNKFYKAVDNHENADLPRELKMADFQKWLSSIRRRDKEMTVSVKSVTIVK